jgi:hypothetical protein
MEEITKNWTYDDYLHFLLIHAAYSDLNIADEEKEHIVKTANAEKYEELLEFYRNNTDFENMLILHDFKDKFLDTDEKVADVFNKIEDLFYADGEYSINEKNLSIALRMIFE